MEHLPGLGTAIGDIIKPTLQLYEPLLLQNKDEIHSVPKTTYSYGLYERQKLDLYTASKPTLRNGRLPVLIFCYGGGLTMGHKTLSGYAGDLCHANIASFYALNYGYHVVVPDYRLVGKHDAKFPSGGEDVALTIEWISEHTDILGCRAIDIFIMGNSAGGIHTSTWLLHDSFKTSRAKVLSGIGPRLRGTILLSVPFHMRKSNPTRSETNKAYFGDAEAHAPLGLLQTARQRGPIDFIQAGVRTLILNGDLDPVDEILKPRDDFIREWLSIGTKQSTSALAVDMMLGHNHISPFCSLSTGNEEEEAWGRQAAAFCDNVRLFRPSSTKTP